MRRDAQTNQSGYVIPPIGELDCFPSLPRTPLTEVIVDPTINVRAGLDEERVEHLQDVIDQTPPVVAFRTSEGDLLSDGFHRYEAARREGQVDIEVVLKDGTRRDALVYAATANSTHGTPLTRQDFGRAVVRLHELDASLT